MEALFKLISVGFLGLFIILFVGVFAGIFVYFLWNWLMPVIFGLPIITFWQAVGLSWLAGFLTKGSSSSSS